MATSSTERVKPGLAALLESTGEKWLISHVEAWQEKDREGTRSDPGWFHPSDLSHQCDAYLGFLFVGAVRRQAERPRLRRIFDNGHGRDRAWKRYLDESGLSLVKFAPRQVCPRCGADGPDGKGVDRRHICIPDVRVRGECDDLVRNPHTSKVSVFEFKTKNKELWSKLKGPDPDHIIQVQPYMVGQDTDETVIVYECKNCQDLKSFIIPFDRELWQRSIDRIQRIIDHLAEGQAPVRTPLKFDSQCGFHPICTNADFRELVTNYKEKAGLK